MEIPLCINKNVSLKTYNWFELGGEADYFAKPQNNSELEAVIAFSNEKKLPIKILGLGANVLISDAQYRGIIIKLPQYNISHYYLDEHTGILEADAGCSIEQLIKYCFDKALLFGLEEFSGIPSTVGGALFINLHYYSFLISQFIYSAQIYDIDEKKIFTVGVDWFEFGYDTSKVKTNKKYIIISAAFILKRNNILYAEYAKGRSIEIIRHRQNRYPYQKTCGCFFKNISSEEAPTNYEGKKILSAGYYLDKIGVKGELKINNCSVSSRHANMLIHTGSGTSSDIIQLAKIMQKKIYTQYGFLLEPECELIGFEEYPLYTLSNIHE
jgi:UDP-N-acetylmuramate dehydrogenase